MTCEERKDLLLLEVAGALEPGEREELRAHLATGCPVCAANLLEAQATWCAIPLAMQPVAPPVKLKQLLMNRVGERDDRFADSLPIRLFRMLVPAAIAAGIAIIVTHAVLSRQIRELERKATAANVLLNFENKQIESLQSGLAHQQQLVAMLRTPATKLIELAGTPLQPGATACLVCDQKNQKWQLLAGGMNAAPAGKTYELWFVTKAGVKIPACTFDVNSKGDADVMIKVPNDLGPLTLAAVTDEPAGGMPQPTGNFQLTGNVQ